MDDYWETQSWADVIEGIESPGYLSDKASPEAHLELQWSGHTRLRRRFLEVARGVAESEGCYDPWAPRSRELLGVALDVANELLSAFRTRPLEDSMSAETIRERFRLSYPAVSGPEMVRMVRDGQKFDLNLRQFEYGVKAYLDSELRDPEIDRFILTVLVDAKATGFVQAMTERPTIGGKHVWFNYSLEKTAKRNFFSLWLEGRFVDAVTAMIFVIPASLSYMLDIPEDVIFILDIGIFLAIGIVMTRSLWYLLLFPIFLKEKSRLKRKVIDGIQIMSEFYSEYHSTDDRLFSTPHPISVPKLHADVARLAEHTPGIIWPQSLWVMLDDIEERGLRRV